MNSSDWNLLTVATEGEAVEIDGIDVWWHDWRRLHIDTVSVPHPSFSNQMHTLWPYAIEPVDIPILFYAGELSNGVWCFYVPSKGQPSARCGGMTVNERLYESNLADAYKEAVGT